MQKNQNKQLNTKIINLLIKKRKQLHHNVHNNIKPKHKQN